jgi:hypothetical protein
VYPFAALTAGLVFVCLQFSPSYAASGTAGANFLDIPVGARPAALGSAYTALAADAYAPVWNPAGLGFVSQSEIAAQHLSYLESIHDDYLGFAQPWGTQAAWGASIQYLGSGDIQSTDNNDMSLGTFSNEFGAYGVAFGRRFGQTLAVGATGKWIHERLGDFSADAYAADVGLMARPLRAWTFGATVTNLGSRLTFIHESDPLPLAAHVSAAYRPTAFWTFSAEVVQKGPGATDGRGGLEWRPLPAVALRAGYRSDTLKELSALAGLSAGIGVTLWKSEISYAWLPLGDLGTGHYIAAVFHFGREAEASRNLADAFPVYQASGDEELQDIVRLIENPEPVEAAAR